MITAARCTAFLVGRTPICKDGEISLLSRCALALSVAACRFTSAQLRIIRSSIVLQSIKSNFRSRVFDTHFFDRDAGWFLRPTQGCLFFITLGPHIGTGRPAE
jgi:hypothetical protein